MVGYMPPIPYPVSEGVVMSVLVLTITLITYFTGNYVHGFSTSLELLNLNGKGVSSFY